MKIDYAPLMESDIAEVKEFTDQWIGTDYYCLDQIKEILDWSQKDGLNASFTARVDGELAGVRLTHAPGVWSHKFKAITPDDWKIERENAAYFKSLFVSDKFQKLGIGKSLSSKSIEVLKKMGAEAILCHSWLESPGNSSQLYLQKMGFEPVKEHEKFWYEIDYLCTRCAPERCVCTGLEMIKYI